MSVELMRSYLDLLNEQQQQQGVAEGYLTEDPVTSFASKAHDEWRQGWIKQNGGKSMPRVKKNSDGSEGDINVPFEKLHPDWQRENLAAGQAAVQAVKQFPNDIEKAAEFIHIQWMKRNPKADYNAAQHVPYDQLSEPEKEKDRVHVRTMQKLMGKPGVTEGVNAKQIKKDLDAGMSNDAVIGKHANKRMTNTDEIRRVIQQHAWEKRTKTKTKEEQGVTEGASLRQTFKRNENDNQHTENAILLAKHFGTPEEHQQAKDALAYRDKMGGYSSSDREGQKHSQIVVNLHKKYGHKILAKANQDITEASSNAAKMARVAKRCARQAFKDTDRPDSRMFLKAAEYFAAGDEQRGLDTIERMDTEARDDFYMGCEDAGIPLPTDDQPASQWVPFSELTPAQKKARNAFHKALRLPLDKD